MARLHCEGGAFCELSTSQPSVAGRLQSCELTLGAEGQASRRHFQVQPAGTRFCVQDLGSRNGTNLNGERLGSEPVPLFHGDVISVGETLVRYDSAGPALPPGTDLGPCVLGQRLARSRYGTLYAGKQGSLERAVTIELADPDLAGDEAFRAFYEGRARLAGAFDHPAIRAVFDVKRSAGGQLFTVFEALSAESLADELERRAFDREEGLAILKTAATGLAQLHKQSKEHGGFGPRALRRDEKGQLKLSELGDMPRLSPYRADADYQADYASPEEARGHPPGRAADLYSLGLLGHRLFLGSLPYTGGAKAVLTLHGSSAAVPLAERGLPPALEGLLADLLQKVAAERPTAAEVLERLEAISAGGLGAASGEPRPRRPSSSGGNAAPRRRANGLRASGSGRLKRGSGGDHPKSGSGSDAARRAAEGPSGSARSPKATDSAPQRRPLAERSSGRAESVEPDPIPLALLRCALVLCAYAAVAVAASALTRIALRALGA